MIMRFPVQMRVLALLSFFWLPACETIRTIPAPTVPENPIVEETEPDVVPAPDIVEQPETEPTEGVEEALPEPDITVPAPVRARDEKFLNLSGWGRANLVPALRSFKESCKIWARRKDADWLNAKLPKYGKYKDWRSACTAAPRVDEDSLSAVEFFETHFAPFNLANTVEGGNLLTAYYAPEVEVRHLATPEFSAPILARPKSAKIQKLPRAQLSVTSAKVLAYGRPIDVFFLQIQGSGRLKFEDGSVQRAAFDGHNSHSYVSIGRLLVERGEMTKDQASKQAIENWMKNAGYEKSKTLMNDNPRYIFFKLETIIDGQGPKGSMRAPLTANGSMAVDPRYHPYGALIWVETKLPQRAGDFTGTQTGLLVSAQDTGGAIKGPRRGDLYFGAGDQAGKLAGVMKHPGQWTLLLPRALASGEPEAS